MNLISDWDRGKLQRLSQIYLRNNSYLFALLLLVITIGLNYSNQDNLFELGVMNRNLRVFLPLMILAVGQTIVIIGGGIDLSVGAMVSIVNAVLVTLITPESSSIEIIWGITVAISAGILAGAFNGFCVAYLRLQPIVTTYATGFVFTGVALLVLPRPGGELPRTMSNFYRRNTPGVTIEGMADIRLPLAIYIIIIILLFWWVLRATRYGQFLYATGGDDHSAYTTGIPVTLVRFSTYLWSGFFAALAGLALTMNTGTGTPRIGDAMTLESIVAVVLGGTRLSGGQGGIAGSIIGVAILGFIRNVISFANVSSWHQDLVDALIIVVALAGPGIMYWIRVLIKRLVKK
jgi:ribose transport system permease protein